MLCDPSGTATVTGPSLKDGQGHVEYLIEVCDPCQSSTYEIHGLPVSDFVTPAYYATVPASDAQCSFTGRCKRPRQVLEDGYITWRTPAPDPAIWQALAPRDKGTHAVVPVDRLEVKQIALAPPALSRHWVDGHEKALHKKRLKRPKSRKAPDNAATRYGEALRTEISVMRKPLAGEQETFIGVLRKLADPKKKSFHDDFRKDPGKHFGHSGAIDPPDELPTPQQYQGVLQALEQSQRFGMDFSASESIEWLSKLA